MVSSTSGMVFYIDVQMLYNLLQLFIFQNIFLLAFLFLFAIFLPSIYFYIDTVCSCAFCFFLPNPLSFTINKDSFFFTKGSMLEYLYIFFVLCSMLLLHEQHQSKKQTTKVYIFMFRFQHLPLFLSFGC